MIQNPKLLGIQRTGKCNPKRNPLQVTLVVKNPPANAGALRDLDSVPGWGRSLGEENGSPLHYSCLENPHGQSSLEGSVRSQRVGHD